jgi:predicted metal-dependent hydrolase
MKPRNMTNTFTDDLLGLITIRIHTRARRIIMRPIANGVIVTVPPHALQSEVKNSLQHFRQRLHAGQLKIKNLSESNSILNQNIGPDFCLKTDLVSLSLEQGAGKKFHLRAEPGNTIIIYPPHTQFEDSERQEWLHRVVERSLKQQGQWILPKIIRELSVRHNLPFGICKVNISKGRWGSCSGKKDINLSCYIMLLPTHLREYVMLHELCHTREMNHGPRFWALLDEVTNGNAKMLRNELKGHHTCF